MDGRNGVAGLEMHLEPPSVEAEASLKMHDARCTMDDGNDYSRGSKD